MEFIREDGRIYDVEHKDTQNRLKKDDKFNLIDNVTVEDLKNYARERKITGYSSMTRAELITALKWGWQNVK